MASDVKWNLVSNLRHQNIISICNNESSALSFSPAICFAMENAEAYLSVPLCSKVSFTALKKKKNENLHCRWYQNSVLSSDSQLTTSATLGKSPTKVTVLPKQRVWIVSSMNEKACYLPHIGRTTFHPLASPQFPQVFYKGKIASVNFSTCFTFFCDWTCSKYAWGKKK